MKKPKLPKWLYMVWNTDGDEPFLDNSEDVNLLAEKGETVEAGYYVLQAKVKLVNKTEVIEK